MKQVHRRKAVSGLLWLCLPAAGMAQPYSFHKEVDLPLIGGMLAMKYGSAAMLTETRETRVIPSNLHRGSIPLYDRWAIGFYSPRISAMSSVVADAELAIPVMVNAFDIYHGDQQWYGTLVDVLLLEEATTISSSVSSFSKSFRVHSTPLTYASNVPYSEKVLPQNVSSFFSDHTTFAFTTAVFSAYTFQLRHPESPLVPWVWAGSLAMATGVGSMRVMAGKHFPSDVVAGAAVGAFFGYLIPRLHVRGGYQGSEKHGKPSMLSKIDWNVDVAFLDGIQTPAPVVKLSF